MSDTNQDDVMDKETYRSMNETSECLKLLDKIGSCSAATKVFIDSMKDKITSNIHRKNTTMDILDVKNDMLLSYLIDLVHTIMIKCYGNSIQENQLTVKRLVELRVMIEKLTSLEGNLKYQIEKLTKAASGNVPDDTQDKLNARANVQDFMDQADVASSEDDEGTSSAKIATERDRKGLYVPPKLAAVHYDEDSSRSRRKKLLDSAKKNMLNNSIMQELREEYLEAPTEITHTNTLRTTKSRYEQQKEEYEETYFTRLPATKKDKKLEKFMSSFTSGQLSDHILNKSVASLGKRKPKSKAKKKTFGKRKKKSFSS